jgi:hypothetical protein
MSNSVVEWYRHGSSIAEGAVVRAVVAIAFDGIVRPR